MLSLSSHAMIVPFIPSRFDTRAFNLRDERFHLTINGEQIGTLLIQVAQQFLARRIHKGHCPQIDMARTLAVAKRPPPAFMLAPFVCRTDARNSDGPPCVAGELRQGRFGGRVGQAGRVGTLGWPSGGLFMGRMEGVASP